MKVIRCLYLEGRALRSTSSGPRAGRGAARPRPGGSPALQLVLCLLASVLWAASARTAEPTDLAPDLGYLRVRSIVHDHDAIAAALAKPRALVLDLRHPPDERGAGETLRKLLEGSASQSRRYVLVGPATPVPVVGTIAANLARLITLGIKDARPAPQVVVEQTAEADRAAYVALESGTSLAQLVSGKIEKERFDEAALVKEFKNGNHDARPPEATPAPGKETAAPPIDRVLQRALHLHRALQALKR